MNLRGFWDNFALILQMFCCCYPIGFNLNIFRTKRLHLIRYDSFEPNIFIVFRIKTMKLYHHIAVFSLISFFMLFYHNDNWSNHLALFFRRKWVMNRRDFVWFETEFISILFDIFFLIILSIAIIIAWTDYWNRNVLSHFFRIIFLLTEK